MTHRRGVGMACRRSAIALAVIGLLSACSSGTEKSGSGGSAGVPADGVTGTCLGQRPTVSAGASPAVSPSGFFASDRASSVPGAAVSTSVDHAGSGPVSPGAMSPALPDLPLDCFDGSGKVRLARLGSPAIVNLWASWCGSCRSELPAFQSFSDRTDGAVAVIGVITHDRRSAAQSIVDDLNLTFPMLDDRDRRLLQEVDRVTLPVTLFVDAAGRIVYVYSGAALDRATLRELAQRHLGVEVSG